MAMKMHQLIRTPLFIALTAFLASCQTMGKFGANKHSFHQKNELVTLKINEKKNSLADLDETRKKSMDFVIDAGAKLLVKGVSYAMKKEAKHYKATYTKNASGDSMDEFGGFTISREIANQNKSSPGDSNDTTNAMTANFGVRTSAGGHAFKLELEKIELKYAKAKVPFHEDEVDMIIKVIIKYVTPDRQNGTIEESFVLNDVKLNKGEHGKPASSDWIPAPKKVNGTSYDLHVSITETNDFGKWFEKISSEIDSNQDSLIKALKGS